MRQRIGQILVAKGLLEADELEKALALQRERSSAGRDKLGKLLIEMGLVSSRDLLPALAEQMGIALLVARIDGRRIDRRLDRLECLGVRIHLREASIVREPSGCGARAVRPQELDGG